MKGKLKAMFTRNIGMKLVSIAIAFLVWVSIINLSDPQVTKTLSGIPIEIRNEALVNGENQTYVSDSPKTVTIRVTGARSKLENVSADDYCAYIDFKEMSNVYAVPVHVEAKNAKLADEIEITKQSLMMVSGKIEESNEDTKDVIVRIIGTPDNYYARCSWQSLSMQQIYGAEKTIKEINSLVATVDLAGSHQSLSQAEVKLAAVDRNGKEVDLTDVKLPLSTIVVDIEVLPVAVKEVFLDTTYITAASGRGIVDIDYRSTIPIAAEQSKLDSIDKIKITCLSQNMLDSQTIDVSVSSQLDPGVYFASESDIIQVKITVEQEQARTFTERTAFISVRNLTTTLKSSFEQETIAITIYDLNKNLENYKTSELGLYIDLSEVEEAGNVTVDLHSTLPKIETSLRTLNVKIPVVVTSAEDTEGEGDNGEPRGNE
ncbi:MAG: hypothetical protein IK055_03380 [Lachnospiraceae bacterium]|nr:hypothetical protein [Lachnospiraceae bacterium]